MHSSSFHIRSDKFPVLQEDRDECCNPGTYGKSLVDYIHAKLEDRRYTIAFSVAEDFGWWIEIKTGLSAPTNIIVRRSHEDAGVADFAVMVDDSSKKWSWKRFRFVDLRAFQEALASDVCQILSTDPDISFIADNLDDYYDNHTKKKGEQDAPSNGG